MLGTNRHSMMAYLRRFLTSTDISLMSLDQCIVHGCSVSNQCNVTRIFERVSLQITLAEELSVGCAIWAGSR